MYKKFQLVEVERVCEMSILTSLSWKSTNEVGKEVDAISLFTRLESPA